MDPVLLVAALWAAFLGTHIGLAAAPVRSRLARGVREPYGLERITRHPAPA